MKNVMFHIIEATPEITRRWKWLDFLAYTAVMCFFGVLFVIFGDL